MTSLRTPSETATLRDGAVTEAKLAAGALAGSEARIAELEETVAAQQELLDGVSRVSVGGHDTLRLTEMNLQLVNGTGTTGGNPNGLGNLIVGYNPQRQFPAPATRVGSHYLIVGDGHEWTRFGGILAGLANTASGDWASVSGGRLNTASDLGASVSGGFENTASGDLASVPGALATLPAATGHRCPGALTTPPAATGHRSSAASRGRWRPRTNATRAVERFRLSDISAPGGVGRRRHGVVPLTTSDSAPPG